MNVFWSRYGIGAGNFGDRLTPFLLEHFGVHCKWSAPEHIRLRDLKRAWMAQLKPAEPLRELARVIPPEAKFILVDEDQLRSEIPSDRVLPYLEKEGEYWGPPETEEAAVAKLERLRQGGAGFIVFAWPAFWWLAHYQKFAGYLRTNYRCMLQTERLVAFDLRTTDKTGRPADS